MSSLNILFLALELGQIGLSEGKEREQVKEIPINIKQQLQARRPIDWSLEGAGSKTSPSKGGRVVRLLLLMMRQ